MRTRCLTIVAMIIVIYISGDTNCETIEKILSEKIVDGIEENSTIVQVKNSPCKGKKCFDHWMSVMGVIKSELMGVQALVVKDENLRGACDSHDRKAKTKYLMCSGSILNRNHVLTSASCLHKSTHIKHNIRGTFAVAIAPLKSSIQIIRVLEYKIHPEHNPNPYAKNHLTHNLAILKLACRIEMENFNKIDLPKAPFAHTCSEENCLIAIYRKVKRRSWVVYQALAPHVPLQTRRRKQTMTKDDDERKHQECRKNETITYSNYRPKRKMAEHPTYIGLRYDSRRTNGESDNFGSNMTNISTSEDSPIEETTMILDATKNSSFPRANSLKDDEDWSRPVGEQRIKSFVVRSSDGFRACAQTGSPIMLNNTQSAVAAVPCDDRQPNSRWGYTDLFDNLSWLHEILQDWIVNAGSGLPGGLGPGNVNPSGPGGNFSSCSTCIFNFFIEIGCKDKNQCGNKTGTTSVQSENSLDPHENGNSMGVISKPKGQGCSNTVGIEIGIGQGCDRTKEKIDAKPQYRQNWQKSMNPQTAGSLKIKNSPVASNDEISKQSVTSGPQKSGMIGDQRATDNVDKYSRKDSSRISPSSRRSPVRPVDVTSLGQNYKVTKGENKNSERVTNEIGPENIEVEPTDWLSEVEKGLRE